MRPFRSLPEPILRPSLSSFVGWVGLTVFLLFCCKYVINTDDLFDEVCSVRHHRNEIGVDEIAVTLAFLSVAWLKVAFFRGFRLRREILERLETEKENLLLARHDALTGLLNRRIFLDNVAAGLAAAPPGTRCAMLFIDLDRFKMINDTYGHAAGDAVLTRIGRRLQDFGGNTFITRLGGDEFAVFFPSTAEPQDLARSIGNLGAQLAQPIDFEGVLLRVDTSIGIATGMSPGPDASTLLRNADTAMYKGKRCGGRTIRFFEDWMDAELKLHSALRAELRPAIERGEIVPFFQPLVDLQTGDLRGYEALARWMHPLRGMLSPDLFIPLVEEEGLADALLFSMLRQACALVRAEPGLLRVSVNVSPVQLTNPALATSILGIVEEIGFDPFRLEVEITESALVEDSRMAQTIIKALQEAGVCVSLDDFGTGFSSLYHLKEMAFDKIKLDRSFLGGALHEPENARYVRAVIALGKAIGIEVTAEGIEDRTTAEWLSRIGCSYGQGYFFGVPSACPELKPHFCLTGLLTDKSA